MIRSYKRENMNTELFQHIIQIINQIGIIHKRFSIDFYKNHAMYNLKSTTLAKIVNEHTYDEDFFNLLRKYINMLTFFDFNDQFASHSNQIEIRTRVKYEDSAFNKIFYYRFGKRDIEIPLQKFVNDLYGIRLIVDENFDYEH